MHYTIDSLVKNRCQFLRKMFVILLCIVISLLASTTSVALQVGCYCDHNCGCGCETDCSCVNVICSACEAVIKKRYTPEQQTGNLSSTNFSCAKFASAVNTLIDPCLFWISSANPVETNIRMNNQNALIRKYYSLREQFVCSHVLVLPYIFM